MGDCLSVIAYTTAEPARLGMTVKAGYVTPMLHVQSVEDSIRFYTLLGFETIDQMGERGHLGWARMHCEGGALMFLLAEDDADAPHDKDAPEQAVLFAMYTPDLPAFREHLRAHGVQVPAITYPGYMPSGQLELRDPDGYIISVNHWSKKEHDAWEAERRRRLATG